VACADNAPNPKTRLLLTLGRLMSALYPTALPQPRPSEPAAFDAGGLYAQLEKFKSESMPAPSRANGALKLPQLNVRLRPYQEEGVRWMLSREKGQPFFSEEAQARARAQLPHGWVALQSPNGEDFFYNPVNVGFSPLPPKPWSTAHIPGGILADEVRGYRAMRAGARGHDTESMNMTCTY
jgi:SNF2 family DNA or RNA helicase